MFDGLHLGHQSVIGSAVHSARQSNGIAGALTFWPHPSRLFRPESPVPQIMGPDTKAALMLSLGIDLIIEQPFDQKFAAIPAESFVGHLRTCLPTLAAIYVGENWRFGRGRQGDIHLLVKLAQEAGVDLVSAARLQRNGLPISSTRIRQLLADGEISTANSLLGYTYFSEARVRPGKQLGRELGFPTLNMEWNPELKPRYGVYVVQVIGTDGEHIPGVANYGLRPTVDPVDSPPSPTLEVHLLQEQSPFTRGDPLRVEWRRFLRPERKFAGLTELKEQIRSDVQRARALLASE
jgi:riboflavin kinase / FMN adenylyltransferase